MFGLWSALLACRKPEPEVPARALLLNEIVSDNVSGWVDPASGECPEHDDTIELFHAGRQPLALGTYTLEDASGVSVALPDLEVAPGERVLLVADDTDAPFHLPFAVSASGDTLTLRRGAEVVDRVAVPPLSPDVSWGRWGDGGAWRELVPTPGLPNEAPPADPCFADGPGFDDHSVPCLATREGFDALASGRAGTRVVKFEVLGFPDRGTLEVAFLDNRFYDLHDEWYLFRMFNGAPVRGEDQFQPFHGPGFSTIDALYDWALRVDLSRLFPPEFATFTSTGRLTSARFYTLALGEPRRIGAGTLIHVDADRNGDEVWAFELEYGDVITHDELRSYFETLEDHLAPEVGAGLRWLVRSAEQEALAARMEAEGLSYADRVVRYAELSEPGTVEVYRGGTVAGRVRIVRAGMDGLEDAGPTDILVLDEVPDYLPPCAALITTVPQTPLAHVALLAESRGIPNLSVTGLSADPQWESWGRLHLPVALRATSPDGFEVRELSADEYLTWQALGRPALAALEPTPWRRLPWVVDLSTVPVESMPDQRSVLGGKSTGYLALLHTPGVVTPEPVLGLTIRAYQTHLEGLRAELDAVLSDPAFARPGDEEVRYLVLEGRGAFAARYPAATFVDAWLADHPTDGVLGRLARADGLRGLVAATPLPEDVRTGVLGPLADAFGDLSPEQGLRFRSSSNVEDAEGFVGAGLYTSNTGYLSPGAGPSVEEALRETFASYWGAEAFEERHAVGIDHRNGAMGVTVHPNFDDDLELSNGVLHLTRLPDGTTELRVNSQVGAVSVTNPPVDACRPVLPEVAVVRDGGVIERLQRSTERPGGDVLSDRALRELFAQVAPVLDTWMTVDNAATPPAQDRSTLTLDLEFREVADGWPVYADGRSFGERMILKQCRSLEPAPVGVPPEVRALPIPKDVLGRAREVWERRCTLPEGEALLTLVRTDPALTPDVGYATLPFVAEVVWDGVSVDWTEFATVDVAAPDDVALTFTPDAAARLGRARLDVGPRAACSEATAWAAPATWLDDLLDE